jgi:two-component system sensor kinase
VAHDLRAPLRAIGGFARVLLDEYPGKLDETGERYLNIIYQEAFKMGRLIDDLLALARLGRKEMRYGPIAMTELAQTIFKELKAAHPERNLQIDIQPLPQAYADSPMIRQVLTNLFLNAIKFTRTRETALIKMSGWSEGRDHVYCVRDNGVGFDMRYADKLFGVFQRLHPETEFEGTGTGLAIVKRIIERHGGRIWGESVVNEGAAFYFTLPKKAGT